MLGNKIINFNEGVVGKVIEYEDLGEGFVVVVGEGVKRNGDVIVWKDVMLGVDLL